MLNITNLQGNANQNDIEISSTPVRIAIIKRQEISVDADGEKRNPCALLMRV